LKPYKGIEIRSTVTGARIAIRYEHIRQALKLVDNGEVLNRIKKGSQPQRYKKNSIRRTLLPLPM
jgi:hypothetical protein